MMRAALTAAAIGLAAVSIQSPASAQALHFDPALQATTAASPMLVDVQFQRGGGELRRPGGHFGGGQRFGGGRGGQHFGGGGDFRRHRGGGGFGVGAGVAGLAAGALIGGA